jgi:hypothetical protein
MWDHVHFDEPPPYAVYVACQRGLIARQGTLAFTLTPLRVAWLYDRVYCRAKNLFNDGDESIHAIHVSIHDNPYLNKQWIQQFLDSLSPDEREAREMGKFMHLIGLVWKGFAPQVHIYDQKHFKVEEHWPKGMVVDPHTRKPAAIGWFTVTPDNRVVFFKEWPETDFYKFHSSPIKTVPGYADLIKRTEEQIPGGPDSVIYRIIDPNYGHTGGINIIGKNLIDEFAKEGVYFIPDVSDNVDEGIHAVSRMLDFDPDIEVNAFNKPLLYFTSNCKNFIYGMTHFVWEEWRHGDGKALKEEPSKEFDDFPALVRYMAMFDPQFFDLRMIEKRQATYMEEMARSRANSGLGV